MKNETLQAVKSALENSNLDALFTDAIGETPEDCENDNHYALMFNVETNGLFFLQYATQENNWAQIAEQQNPWIKIGSVSATDILMGDPTSEISDRLDYEFEQQQQMDAERENY